MTAPPFSKQPVVARARRGDPTSAEMQLLAQAHRAGHVTLEHRRGMTQPAILALAFAMTERTRGWLQAPEAPEVVDGVRHWRFTVTDAGLAAYRGRMAQFGVEV